jgi:hypothetical protein
LPCRQCPLCIFEKTADEYIFEIDYEKQTDGTGALKDLCAGPACLFFKDDQNSNLMRLFFLPVYAGKHAGDFSEACPE